MSALQKFYKHESTVSLQRPALVIYRLWVMRWKVSIRNPTVFVRSFPWYALAAFQPPEEPRLCQKEAQIKISKVFVKQKRFQAIGEKLRAEGKCQKVLLGTERAARAIPIARGACYPPISDRPHFLLRRTHTETRNSNRPINPTLWFQALRLKPIRRPNSMLFYLLCRTENFPNYNQLDNLLIRSFLSQTLTVLEAAEPHLMWPIHWGSSLSIYLTKITLVARV